MEETRLKVGLIELRELFDDVLGTLEPLATRSPSLAMASVVDGSKVSDLLWGGVRPRDL
jgi:hypothetical protein